MSDRRVWRQTLTLLAGLLLSLPVSLAAQQEVRVEQLRAKPDQHRNEVRTVTGVVSRYVASGSETTSAFLVEDNYGQLIRVVTSVQPPERGAEVRVTGVVNIASTGDPFLVAEEITRPGRPAQDTADEGPTDTDGDGVVDARDRCPGTPPGETVNTSGCVPQEANWPLWAGIGGGAVLLVGVGLFFYSRQRQQQPAAVAGGGASSAPSGSAGREAETQKVQTPSPSGGGPSGASAEEDTYDGETVKFTRPSAKQGTLQLLPGRMEIVEGEDRGEEIRFMKPASGTEEFTFGRREGPEHTHVQLKERTVSRDHAVMRRMNGQWRIQNRSDTNPVRVNGQKLSTEGGATTLSDGDRVEMGEVAFRFHEG